MKHIETHRPSVRPSRGLIRLVTFGELGRRSRGQALVETALVLPVLLVLLLLAVDFGRLFTTHVAINNAAREGAFYAAEHAKDTTPADLAAFAVAVEAAALREVNVQGQGGEGTLSVTGPICHVAGAPLSTMTCDVAATSASVIGNHVTVSVTRPFSLITPIVGELFGGSVDLNASATAPVLSPASVTILPPAATPSPQPTPTPAPTPTPDPGATPTPTPDPGATPTPAPTPTPEPTCSVPRVDGQYYNADPGALDAWELADFTGPLVNESSDKKIKTQSLQPFTSVLCSSSMAVSNDNQAYPYP